MVDFTSPIASEDETQIAAYLRLGTCIYAVGRVESDVLDPGKFVPLPVGKLTDGVYAWPSALYYYVSKYHIRLPTEFVQRMRSLSWSPPVIKIPEDLEEIEFVRIRS